MIHCIFKINEIGQQALSSTHLMKNHMSRETDLAYFLASEYRMKFPQMLFHRPSFIVYLTFKLRLEKIYKKFTKYLHNQRDIFQKFWNKNVFEVNSALESIFGNLVKKNMIFNVKLNLIRNPISYTSGNTFTVLYKLDNKKLIEECIYQISMRLWHVQFRKVVGPQKNTVMNNTLLVLLAKMTILFFFQNGPLQKFKVRYPYESFLLDIRDEDKKYIINKLYDIYLNNSYEDYLKKAWDLLKDNEYLYTKLFNMYHTETSKYNMFIVNEWAI